jgi:hypothetical protein
MIEIWYNRSGRSTADDIDQNGWYLVPFIMMVGTWNNFLNGWQRHLLPFIMMVDIWSNLLW